MPGTIHDGSPVELTLRKTSRPAGAARRSYSVTIVTGRLHWYLSIDR